MKRFLAVLAAIHAVAAPAFEGRWTQGLQVSWEEMSGSTYFGGMSFLIQRATGRDVSLLAQRILEDWRRESGLERVRLLAQGEWSVASRIHHGRSEVTQWRLSGSSPELLWSESELYGQSGTPPDPRYLVSVCNWTGPVRGTVAETRYVQATGHCASRPSTVLDTVEAALVRDGWRTRRSRSGLSGSRINAQVQVTVTPANQRSGAANRDGGSAAVILEMQSVRKLKP